MNYTPTKPTSKGDFDIDMERYFTSARTSVPTYLQTGETLHNPSWLLTCARFAVIWISYQDHGRRVEVKV